MKEGNTNPDLFYLLLQKDVKEFLESAIIIQKNLIFYKFNKIVIDYWVTSLGDIDLDTVTIRMYDASDSNYVMFSINKHGEYINNYLCDEDIALILSLTEKMKYGKGYNIFDIPKDIRIINKTNELERIL